jgi:hypothetical protein
LSVYKTKGTVKYDRKHRRYDCGDKRGTTNHMVGLNKILYSP